MNRRSRILVPAVSYTHLRQFVRGFRKATRLQEISELSAECKSSPLAQVFEDVYETYKRQTGGSGPPRNLIPLERSAQTAASEAVTTLERRMTWLATISSTTVYVGLFGTVVGLSLIHIYPRPVVE